MAIGTTKSVVSDPNRKKSQSGLIINIKYDESEQNENQIALREFISVVVTPPLDTDGEEVRFDPFGDDKARNIRRIS